MIQMTMQVSEELAERIQPLSHWLPTIIELGLLGLETNAAATAAEIVQFLSLNPSSQEVLAFQVSDKAQMRLQRLLSLNQAGLLSTYEQQELDELEQIEHVMVLLKVQVAPTSPLS